MVNLSQNPILFGDSLWLYHKDEKTIYMSNKRKRKLVREALKNILLFFKL